VDEVIPVALRRWRSSPWRALSDGEWRRFGRHLRARAYALVIDAQGLIKSAAITRLARGVRCGLDRRSAREPLAALAYRRTFSIPRGQHAITRLRQLFSAALGYPLSEHAPDYGLSREQFLRGARGQAPVLLNWALIGTPSAQTPSAQTPSAQTPSAQIGCRADESPYLVFLHGTTWPTKLWPESHWQALADLAARADLRVYLPWGNDTERARAGRLAQGRSTAEVLAPMTLTDIASLLAGARGAVAVDTGLAHLAAALGTPAVTLYGATEPQLTGTWGERQLQLRAELPCAPCLSRRCVLLREHEQRDPPCYQALSPDRVWEALSSLLGT
jgi:lipopolysaccharide heptosyltransferase I